MNASSFLYLSALENIEIWYCSANALGDGGRRAQIFHKNTQPRYDRDLISFIDASSLRAH